MEWGKRQAAKAPQWNEQKWTRIATIFQVTFTDQGHDQDDQQHDEQARDVA